MVAERFELSDCRGRGGMGAVFKATDRGSGSVVAIKFLARSDPELLLGFKEEFRAMTLVDHPNLAKLYQFYQRDWLSCFTMEYVDGHHLSTWWRAREAAGDAAEPVLRNAMLQLAEGLDALHGEGKLHRDVKPSNVMVRAADEHVVVLDFGLVTSNADRLGLYSLGGCQVAGTVPFMSPEQMTGEPVGPGSDWYSFGVVLYELLAGYSPFRGSYERIFELKKRESFAPLPESVSPDLARLCVTLLRCDPAERPEFGKIRAALGAAAPAIESISTTSRLSLQIVGRDVELGRLQDAFLQCTDGQATAGFLHGDSGIGKSTILEAYQEWLDRRATPPTVLAGRCYEQESIPYKGFDAIVDQLAAYLTLCSRNEVIEDAPEDLAVLIKVFPALGVAADYHRLDTGDFDLTLSPARERRMMLAAMGSLLSALSQRRPLVLLLDDLQWCDPDCCTILQDVLEHHPHSRILVVGAYRRQEGARNEALTRLRGALRGGPSFDVAVEPLDSASLSRLAKGFLGEGSASGQEAIDSIARKAKGSPYFLLQLAAALERGEENPEIGTLLDRQLEGLGRNAAALLETLATSGRPLPRKLAILAAGLVGSELDGESVLRSNRLIKSRGPEAQDTIDTYHDRVREGVIGALDPGVLKSRHLSLAEVLEQETPEDHENLARHYRGAQHGETAGRYYLLAGRDAGEVLAFDKAAELYRLSLECSEAEGLEAARTYEALGEALANANRGEVAGEALEKAADRVAADRDPNAPEEMSLRRRAAHQFMIAGHFDRGREVIRGVLATAGMKMQPTHAHAFVRILTQTLRLKIRGLEPRGTMSDAGGRRLAEFNDVCWATACGLGVIDVFRAADFHLRALHLAMRCGDPARIARSLALHAIHTAAYGVPAARESGRLLAACDKYCDESDDPYSPAVLRMARSGVAMLEGRFRDSVSYATESEGLLTRTCTGVAWEIDTVRVYKTYSLLFMGQIAQLRETAPRMLEDALDRGDVFQASNLRSYVLPHVLIWDGRAEEALEMRREAIEAFSQSDFHAQHLFAMISYAEAQLYLGRPEEALRYLAEQRPRFRRSFLDRIQNASLVVGYVRGRAHVAAAARAPDARGRRRLLAAARKDAKRMLAKPSVSGGPYAHAVLAGVASAEGHREAVTTHVQTAYEGFRNAGMELQAAASGLRLATLVQSSARADELRREADDWWSAQAISDPAQAVRTLVPLAGAGEA